MEKKERDIRINVNNEFLKRLQFIKGFYGVKSNAEMIRVLVSEKFHEITKKEKS